MINTDQLFMACFLTLCALMNLWFIVTSHRRATTKPTEVKPDTAAYQLLSNATYAMALFDFPWVFFCFVQCWYNVFTSGQEPFNQSSGPNNVGCKFMGWYSSFSLYAMMGSHCLVAYYLYHLLKVRRSSNDDPTLTGFLSTTKGFFTLASIILVVACVLGLLPLIEGSGYLLTNSGFCYSDFTNRSQSIVMITYVIIMLALSTTLWLQIGMAKFWVYYTFFFITWFLWIPACAYGIANGIQLKYPYLLVGAIIGHGNALINPILYGLRLYKIVDADVENNEKVLLGGEQSETDADLI